MDRVEAMDGILKVNGKIIKKGAKIKIEYKASNIQMATYIGYNPLRKLFEFEKESTIFKGEKFILRISGTQVNYRKIYA